MKLFDLAAAGRETEAGRTASSRAIVRGAAQRAPELIREFIEGRASIAAAVRPGGGGRAAEHWRRHDRHLN